MRMCKVHTPCHDLVSEKGIEAIIYIEGVITYSDDYGLYLILWQGRPAL